MYDVIQSDIDALDAIEDLAYDGDMLQILAKHRIESQRELVELIEQGHDMLAGILSGMEPSDQKTAITCVFLTTCAALAKAGAQS